MKWIVVLVALALSACATTFKAEAVGGQGNAKPVAQVKAYFAEEQPPCTARIVGQVTSRAELGFDGTCSKQQSVNQMRIAAAERGFDGIMRVSCVPPGYVGNANCSCEGEGFVCEQ